MAIAFMPLYEDNRLVTAIRKSAAAGEEVIVLILVNWMILIMVKIILMIRDNESDHDFDKHDSDNPVDQCDCFDHNNACL